MQAGSYRKGRHASLDKTDTHTHIHTLYLRQDTHTDTSATHLQEHRHHTQRHGLYPVLDLEAQTALFDGPWAVEGVFDSTVCMWCRCVCAGVR